MAFNFSTNEFIKLYRKFLNWEWYLNTNTKTLFIHCLLRANWKEGCWQGVHYKAGEFITSLASLSEETGLTIRQVRTALKHLISTGEITSSLTDSVTGKKLTKCRIITINNWNEYQGSDKQKGRQATGKRSSKRQGSDKQATTDKELIRTIEDKEIKEKPAALSPPEEDIDWDSVEWVDLSKMSDEEYAAWEEEQRGKGAL